MHFPCGRYLAEVETTEYELPAAWGPDGERMIEVDVYVAALGEEREREE